MQAAAQFQLDAYEQQVIDIDNAKASNIFISGASGPCATGINGLYSPTRTRGLDGRILYIKRSNASMCIEHSTGVWQVRYMSRDGSVGCWAGTSGGCALEACTSRTWRVSDHTDHRIQPGVKIVTGADAEHAVSDSSSDRNSLTLNPETQC